MTTNPAGQTDPADLTAEELRVLACLIEKAFTTPDQYPLSTNALTAACNQKSSRDPMVDYPANLVDRVMQLLRDGGWARSIRGSGNRTFKHRHVIDERLGLGDAEQSIVAVLALRGPQSPGELKTRTERYHPFADLDDVQRVLERLASREPPLVRDVGRGSGQSQNRWVQLLGPTPGADAPDRVDVTTAPPAASTGPAGHQAVDHGSVPAPNPSREPATATTPATDAGQANRGDDAEVVALRARVEALERRLGDLERELGLQP